MHQLGYVDGQNIVFERRFAAGRYELLGVDRFDPQTGGAKCARP
jgi:hypothetical protein